METQHFFAGGGATNLHPLVLAVVLVASVAVLCLPRRYVLVPLMSVAVMISLDEQIVAGGIHITMSRLLVFIGLSRLMIEHNREGGRVIKHWSRLDTVFISYCVWNALSYVVLWAGDEGALINRLGFLYNSLGTYVLVRFFLRTRDDLNRLIKTFVWAFAIIAIVMANEQLTGKNLFSHFGGVSEQSVVRDGKIRARGPFVHPLTAGAIGATLLPLTVGLWWVDKRHNKGVALVGATSAVVVGLTSASSTAVLTLAAGVLGLWLWRWRRHMRSIRWSIVAALAVLQLVMKAPVWALIARVDLTGSSSGYHRYLLIDMFIRRFSDWWLIGTRTTANWGWDMWDTINSYVAAGISGGLVNFALFIAVFAIGFQQAGRVRRKVEAGNPDLARQAWVCGAMLFAHLVAFFGIAYFDQSQFVWYASAAMIACLRSMDMSERRQAKVQAQDTFQASTPTEGEFVYQDMRIASLGSFSEERSQGRPALRSNVITCPAV